MTATNVQAFGQYLLRSLPKFINRISIFKDELSLHVAPSALLPTLEFLRDHSQTQFQQLMELTAVDQPTRPFRFELVYCLLSIVYNGRIIVRTYTDEINPIPSATSLFPSAVWSEREVFDLFGVAFSGHPDLRRILTDYGFSGHPLRKDFPLSGFTEIRYDEERKRIVQEPVQLTQEFRQFELGNPWEQVPKKPTTKTAEPSSAAPTSPEVKSKPK